MVRYILKRGQQLKTTLSFVIELNYSILFIFMSLKKKGSEYLTRKNFISRLSVYERKGGSMVKSLNG